MIQPKAEVRRSGGRALVFGGVGVLVVLLLTSAFLTLVRREAACTLAGGISSANLNTAGLHVAQPAKTEVCLDDQCIPLNWSEPMNGALNDQTTFAIVGDNRERALVVRTFDGEILAGPESVELQQHYPNGEACAPELLVGSFAARQDGTIDQLPAEG